MPNMPLAPMTSYGWVLSDVKDLAEDLHRIAWTVENITPLEAALCHFHLNKVLKSLLLATRVSRRRCALLWLMVSSVYWGVQGAPQNAAVFC